ncbi:hypothetical protein FRC00_000706 [Tulasnella sp. 408]|nr:hypothetical protein FRC00_000706 [Tulasnella sp. 408]
MSDIVHDLMAVAAPSSDPGPNSNLTAIGIPLAAIAAGYALRPRHPPEDVLRRAGQHHTAPVVVIPLSGARLQQANPQLADLPQANNHFHPDDPVVAIAPLTPPPNYQEFPLDTRIDGTVPSYSHTSSTIEVVPSPGQNPLPNPLLENADLGEGEEGGHV